MVDLGQVSRLYYKVSMHYTDSVYNEFRAGLCALDLIIMSVGQVSMYTIESIVRSSGQVYYTL
jgi:hypothetical protein